VCQTPPTSSRRMTTNTGSCPPRSPITLYGKRSRRSLGLSAYRRDSRALYVLTLLALGTLAARIHIGAWRIASSAAPRRWGCPRSPGSSSRHCFSFWGAPSWSGSARRCGGATPRTRPRHEAASIGFIDRGSHCCDGWSGRVRSDGIKRACIILLQRGAQEHAACRRERHSEQQPDDPEQVSERE
jgi:hypothetical protein